MPRRQKPGGKGNRTDLSNAPRSQPTRVAPGGAYGSRQASEEAQGAVPLPQGNQTPALDGHVPGGAGGPADMMAALAGTDFAPVGLGGESARPDEPITAGLPFGDGSNRLEEVTHPETNPDLLLWSKWMPMLDLLASGPDSSASVRQLYRRLRSQMPADYEAQGGP